MKITIAGVTEAKVNKSKKNRRYMGKLSEDGKEFVLNSRTILEIKRGLKKFGLSPSLWDKPFKNKDYNGRSIVAYLCDYDNSDPDSDYPFTSYQRNNPASLLPASAKHLQTAFKP